MSCGTEFVSVEKLRLCGPRALKRVKKTLCISGLALILPHFVSLKTNT